MHITSLLATGAAIASFAVLASPSQSTRTTLGHLQSKAFASLLEAEGKTPGRNGCNVSAARVRRDWGSLSRSERNQHIRAVQCLMSSPSKSDADMVPGAKNRFDDFAGQHINQTFTIHRTGSFLSWHRYFLHAYETALRDECGYQGYLPYWNWFEYQDNLESSPVFDGSDTSMGGNGVYLSHNGSLAGMGTVYIPSGEGGGCVTSGPFANMTANLGPVSPAMRGMKPSNGSLAYNPTCLSRDISNYTASTWLTHINLLNLTTGAASATVKTFQDELQGRFSDGFLGLHVAGHFSIGGDADDLFSSPVDPAFYLHHTMLDYVFWIWQALHPSEALTIAGTLTLGNNPPSRDTRLNDTLYFNYLDQPQRPISDVLDTLGGSPLCYIYE